MKKMSLVTLLVALILVMVATKGHLATGVILLLIYLIGFANADL